MHEAQPITEAALAEQLGIERSVLAGARKAVLLSVDVERRGNVISYPPAAVEKLRRHLALEPISIYGKKEPSLVTVTVARRARLNSKIVFAVEKEGGHEIAIRVRDARLITPGQPLRVRLEGATGYAYGPQPRYRGGQSTFPR